MGTGGAISLDGWGYIGMAGGSEWRYMGRWLWSV